MKAAADIISGIHMTFSLAGIDGLRRGQCKRKVPGVSCRLKRHLVWNKPEWASHGIILSQWEMLSSEQGHVRLQ